MAWSSAVLAALLAAGATRRGEIALIESPTTAIDVAHLEAIAVEYARDVGDVPATLVVATAFDDRGAGGPAYYLPFVNTTRGTGQPLFDRRRSRIEGVVNLRRLADHPPGALLPRLAQELAHRHLAYLSARTATASYVLTGRDAAHWRATLESEASLMDGYAWREASPGRFVVLAHAARFSTLDLYGLGLLDPAAVSPFFLILGARTEGGAAIPPAAQLSPGFVVLGVRRDLTIEDVVRAEGPREPARDPVMRAVFALLTAPGTTGTEAQTDELEQLRGEAERAWAAYTGGRGTLCTRVDGCEAPDAGAPQNGDAGPDEPEPAPEGCTCGAAGGEPGALASYLALMMVALRRRPRGPSSCRWSPRGGRRCRAGGRPPR